MSKTKISWTEHVWKPVRGCTRVSPGCQSCYAERWAAGPYGAGSPTTGEKFAIFGNAGPRWTGKVELIESMLDVPLRRKKPTTYFVNSMRDLFHEALPDEAIDHVFAVMALCPQHRFQILTKRAERMQEYFVKDSDLRYLSVEMAVDAQFEKLTGANTFMSDWPLPNVWLGVSVEDQQRANERFPFICELGEAGWNTMVSLEPLLAGVVVPKRYLDLGKRAWCVVGGESGPGARPCNLAWIRSIVEQCKKANVKCFVKQIGATPRDGCFKYACENVPRKGSDPLDWPRDLRVREMPNV